MVDIEILSLEAVCYPQSLLSLADLALEGSVEARERLLDLTFDLRSYHRACQDNPNLLPILAVLPELGFGNVQSLLTALVAIGPQVFFFSMAGVAAEGSLAAFAILNEVTTVEQLSTLLGYAEQYGEDEYFGPMLSRLLSNQEFFPKVLDLAGWGNPTVNALVAQLAERGNPIAQDWFYLPAAANGQ